MGAPQSGQLCPSPFPGPSYSLTDVTDRHRTDWTKSAWLGQARQQRRRILPCAARLAIWFASPKLLRIQQKSTLNGLPRTSAR